MRDTLYANVPFRLNEMTHHCGPHVHLVGNLFLLSQLATLCSKGVIQRRMTIVPGGGGFGESMNNAYV